MKDNLKTIIIIGVIGLLIWGAFLTYFGLVEKKTEINYDSYLLPISNDFGSIFTDKIENRAETNLPIKPSEFKKYLR